jgi:hypothetical protein
MRLGALVEKRQTRMLAMEEKKKEGGEISN